MTPFGDRHSDFAQAALPHLEAVYRAAVAICGQEPLAQDLTQTAYLKALQSFATFRPGSNCKAWLLSILRNCWIDYLRSRASKKEVNLDDCPPPADAAATPTSWSNAADLLENFSDKDVIKALTQLPDEQRLTLYLIDVEQMSYADVARITDAPVGTVKSRTSYARSALRARLEEHARELGFMKRADRD
jgi:RNA polymerase sigma-70 factor (ECF subfamily)